MASRVALIAASVSLASSAPPPPALWGQSLLGTPGRSGQGSLNGPVPSTEWAGAAHLVDVKWRWALPRDTASSFFYGGIDASGDVYYSDTGNGAGPTVVYKIRGDTGVTNWKSDQLPRPTYGNFYGNDHLIVGPGRDPGIFVVAGTTYTLADCAWVTRLDAKTGAPTWWINGTATVWNALLSRDGATLYLHFYNASVAAVDAASGRVRSLWDLGGAGLVANVTYTASLVEEEAGALDVLVFAAPGNNTAVRADTGAVVWSAAAPIAGPFSSRAAAPAAGPDAGTLFTYVGGNAGDAAGGAAVFAANGSVAWTQPATGWVSALGLPTAQGWEWVVRLTSTSSEVLSVVRQADGSVLATSYFPNAVRAFQFASLGVVSKDGSRAYIFGSYNTGSSPQATALLSFHFDGASAVSLEYFVQLTGVPSPDRYLLVPGPAPGQVALWHKQGVVVVAPRVPAPAPPLPPPPSDAAPGEVIALAFGLPAAACLSSSSAVALVPATLTAPRGSAAPSWLVGAAFAGATFTGQCGSGSVISALDVRGRRAWVLFSCLSLGQAVTAYVARVSLGPVPGASQPAVEAVCTWGVPGSRTASALFFDERVASDAPWFLDTGSPTTKAFYRVDFPPAAAATATLPGAEGAAPPYCQRSPALGQLRAVSFYGSQSLDSRIGGDGPRLYGVARSALGVALTCAQVPSGSPCPGVGAGALTLPCDAGPCFDSLGFFAVGNGTVFTGGPASAQPDWTDATLVQRTPAGLAATSGAGLSLLSSQELPTSPIPAFSVVAALPDPAGDPDSTWVQSLTTGARACLTSDNTTLLLSLRVFGRDAQDFGIAANASVPACPLPVGGGLACYSLAVAHVAPFVSY